MVQTQQDSIGQVDIAIVGAGAAGLTAAIFAAETNRSLRIVLLDRANTIGAKILVSGGGRCNVTNQRVKASDFYGDRKTIDRVLRRFNEEETIRWFHTLGVTLHAEPSGKLFPVSNKARTILDALLNRCRDLGVAIRTQQNVQHIERIGGVFEIHLSDETLRTKQIILATGGRSLPRTGSDGSGWTLVQELGHTVTSTHPALVPLVLDSSFFHAQLSGVSCHVTLTTMVHGKTIDRRSGSLLWTHFGVSGPVVLDASRVWTTAHDQKQDAKIYLNSLPELDKNDLEQWFTHAGTLPGRKTVSTVLATRLPQRMVQYLCEAAEITCTLRQNHPAGPSPRSPLTHTPINSLPRQARRDLINAFTQLPLPIIRSRGWNFAEVTAGGVPLSEINPSTMASKKVSGLYLIGEMLDCDGRIGGFNFQWAWSTGYIAGCHAGWQSI